MTVYRNHECRAKNEAMTDIKGQFEHEMVSHQNFLNERFTWIKFRCRSAGVQVQIKIHFPLQKHEQCVQIHFTLLIEEVTNICTA